MSLADAIGRQLQSDHWQNRATGLGLRGQDKRVMGSVGITIPFREYECEEILTASPIARRLVELPVKDSLRRGFIRNNIEEEVSKGMDREYKRSRIHHNMKLAGFWGRTYGGAGCLISVDDGLDVAEPLDLTRIRHFNGLVPLSRWELWTQFTELETNIANPNFNYPKRYYLQPRRGLPFDFEKVTLPSPLTGLVENRGVKQTIQYNSPIHSSRIIRFDGKWLPIRKRAQNVYWDDSIFTSLWEAMRDFSISHGYLSNIVNDFSTAVMKIQTFASLLSAEGGDDRVSSFLETMSMMRNMLGAIVCGPEDSYEWSSRSVAGLADLIDRIDLYFQACTDIPATILFNKSPSGLNATGDHEMKQWGNEVTWFQKDYWDEKFDRVDEVIMAAKDGPTQGKILDEAGREWIPLEQPTGGEEAEARSKIADTDAKYNEMSQGALGPELIKQRFGGPKFNPHFKLPKDFVVPEALEPEPEEEPEGNPQKDEVDIDDQTLLNLNESEQFKNFAKNWGEMKLGDISPPGWKGTVQRMKKHSEITNPWALSWWMANQGYSPHKG